MIHTRKLVAVYILNFRQYISLISCDKIWFKTQNQCSLKEEVNVWSANLSNNRSRSRISDYRWDTLLKKKTSTSSSCTITYCRTLFCCPDTPVLSPGNQLIFSRERITNNRENVFLSPCTNHNGGLVRSISPKTELIDDLLLDSKDTKLKTKRFSIDLPCSLLLLL